MVADQELLDAWRRGDRRAGDELVGRYFDSVCRYFRSKLGDDIDELLQSTFTACVERRDHFRGEASFRSYLFGIAHNLLLMELRTRRRAPRRDDTSVRGLVDPATSPSGRVGKQEQDAVLRHAIRRLPLEQQTLLELAYGEGLSGREVALALGIPANTVRSRLARAKDAVRTEVRRLQTAGLVKFSGSNSVGRQPTLCSPDPNA